MRIILATKTQIYVFMDCQLIPKQDVFFSLSHDKEEAVLQAFTGHCLDLSQSPASGRSSACPYTHTTHCILQHCSGVGSSVKAVVQLIRRALLQSLAGASRTIWQLLWNVASQGSTITVFTTHTPTPNNILPMV